MAILITGLLRRVFPHPLLSVALFGVWVLMNSPFGTGTLVLATFLALLVPHVMRALEPQRVRIARPLSVLTLLFRFGEDIVKSNGHVASIILGSKKNTRQSGFVRVPLRLTNRYALAILAVIVTGTPGTLWVQYDRTRRVLLLHVLDVDETPDWPKTIKDRYEDLLMEIFP